MPENEKPPANPATDGARRIRWGLPLLIAALCLLTFRFPQGVLKATIDDSWNAVLAFANVNHLRFGDDVVFTYGPLGYLVINRFLPDTAVPRLLLGTLVGVSTITGLCLLLWRMKSIVWRVVWLLFFAVLCAKLHWAGDDLFVELGLFAWGLLCWLESGRRLALFVLWLTFMAVIAALIKFTLAVVAALAVGTIACDLVLRKRKALAAGSCAGFLLGWMAGWVVMGQDLSRVPVFLARWLQIAGGYNLAMSVNESNVALGIAALLAAVLAVIVRVAALPLPAHEHPRWRRGLLLAWLLAQLFLAWKYGYVRSDQVHLALFLVFLPVLALTLEALPPVGARALWTTRGAALACGVAMLVMVHEMNSRFLLLTPGWSYENVRDNLSTLMHADDYTRDNAALQRDEIQKMQLPAARAMIDRSSVDVFGQFGIEAIFNGMNYHPRPIIQSYSAYTPPLMELNERFYLASNAPDYLLFDLEPIDGRFPAVEDALALRAALVNYDMAGADNQFLILKHARSEAPVLKLVREGDLNWNEKISLVDHQGTNLWLELEAKPSLAGRVRQFLYKPPTLQLKVWSATNSLAPRTFPVPACMLLAGFLANPLELNTQDVANLYRGESVVDAGAYALDFGPSGPGPWQDHIHYRLYEIENHLGRRGN